MSFPNLVFTDEGKSLQLKAMNGDSIIFTKVELGNGDRPENISSLTQLNNSLHVCGIDNFTPPKNGYAVIHWSLDSMTVRSDFEWKEYGLFAKDSSNNEILYAYAYDSVPQTIPSGDSSSITKLEADINIAIGDATSVSAIVGEYSAYASKEDFQHHLDTENNPNPHHVTKSDVGLDNVDNVSTNNATPTFSSNVPLAEINSGETATTLWGKVKTAIKALIEHINNRNNPHNITVDKIGAASSAHTHDTGNIVSGYLPIVRGGTGGSSAFAALENLITNAKQHIYLAQSRYIYGKDSNGNTVACCGVWATDGAFFGNDSQTGHLHGKTICIRTTPDNGTTKKYWHINSSGTFYPGKNGDQYFGASSHRIKTIYATNALNTSDRKEKENITDSIIGLTILERLSFKDFNFIGSNEQNVGLIAQDVFDVFQQLGIHNSGAYSVAVKGNDPEAHPELESLTDEQIKSYPDEQLTWSLNYQIINNYCIAGFKEYMKLTNERLSKLEEARGYIYGL